MFLACTLLYIILFYIALKLKTSALKGYITLVGVLHTSDRHMQTISTADWCVFEKARRRDV